MISKDSAIPKLIKRIIISLVGGFFFMISLTMMIIHMYGEVDEIREADTAIILGAAVHGDSPSPVFTERINHGIWLYHHHYIETLIFTGGYSIGNENSDADIAKQYAIAQGVPAAAILIEEKSTITQENLYYAKKIMVEHQLQQAIIVSDPLHMKRSMLMARDMGIEAYSSPTPTTRYQSFSTKTEFLVREAFFYLGYQIYRAVVVFNVSISH